MERCTDCTVHLSRVETARKALQTAPVGALAETFRALGDPTRVGILTVLAQQELCGCDLAALFGVTPSAISHQLRLLKAHRLVRARREGKLVYYGLDDDHVHTLFAVGRLHVEERR